MYIVQYDHFCFEIECFGVPSLRPVTWKKAMAWPISGNLYEPTMICTGRWAFLMAMHPRLGANSPARQRATCGFLVWFQTGHGYIEYNLQWNPRNDSEMMSWKTHLNLKQTSKIFGGFMSCCGCKMYWITAFHMTAAATGCLEIVFVWIRCSFTMFLQLARLLKPEAEKICNIIFDFLVCLGFVVVELVKKKLVGYLKSL